MASFGVKLLSTWQKLSKLPGGKTLFNFFLFRKVPYSGSIKARVIRLEKGYAQGVMCEHRAIKNHFNSVHALALGNFGELVSGLATTTQIPDGMQGIVVKLTTEYFKKARGVLTAESRVPDLSSIPQNFTVSAEIKNSENVLVAKVTVEWTLNFSKGSKKTNV